MQNHIIYNNPYHVLGVYVGASVAHELRNMNRINAYLDIGDAITYDEFDNLLNYKVIRNKETVREATQLLSLPRDRVYHALLWQSDGNSRWGEELNAASSAFAAGQVSTAVFHYDQLIYNDNLREEFVYEVTNGLLTLSAEELAELITLQFKSYADCMESYLNDWHNLYKCPLLKYLFDYFCLDKISAATELMSETTPAIHGKSFDYFQFLSWLKSQIGVLVPYLRIFKEIYGSSSLIYQYHIGKFCSFLYSNAVKIILTIHK